MPLWFGTHFEKFHESRAIGVILRSLPFKWSGSALVCLQLTCEGFHEPTNAGESFIFQKCSTIKRFHKLKLSKISTAWTGKEPAMTEREMIGRAITVTGKTLVAFIISRLASNESWSLEFIRVKGMHFYSQPWSLCIFFSLFLNSLLPRYKKS